ncbi:MAG TPA: STAS-like domain-containing protein [Sphingomicrobium sp.]|jgi:hypothetical protein|nr:STAS-like domain-containing protein [Sphingomicrobium sp.]
MSRVKEFSIAREFSAYPGGRKRDDGPFNGARFRDDFLGPLLEGNDEVVLDLDGLAGLPSSFWEEVFGGLIRHHMLPVAAIGAKLRVRTSEPELQVYIPMAYKYARDAGAA